MPRPASWRFEPTPANTKSPLSKHPTATGPLTLPRPRHSRRSDPNHIYRRASPPPCSALTVVGSAIGRTPTPCPTCSRFRCHHPTRPSATACAGQTGLRVWPSAFGLLRDIEKRTQIFGRSLERCWGPAPKEFIALGHQQVLPNGLAGFERTEAGVGVLSL